jgi:hypothetical protein
VIGSGDSQEISERDISFRPVFHRPVGAFDVMFKPDNVA